jgi:hypothetical protein
LKLLQALKRDLELVGRGEWGRVVEDFNPKKRNNRHGYLDVAVLAAK